MKGEGRARTAAALIVLGIIVVVATVIGTLTSRGPITCEGRPMTAGDTCVTYQYGHETSSKTLAQLEESRRNSSGPGPALVVGGLIVALGLLVGRSRPR